MKKEVSGEKKLEVLVRMRNRLFNGDLAQYVGDAVSYIVHNKKGGVILNSIIQYDWMTREDKIATICLMRAAVFNAAWHADWRVVFPSDPDNTLKFWDEAEDVLDGNTDLVLDIVETSFWTRDPQGNPQYFHTMIDCRTDETFVDDRPDMFWWVTR